MYEVTRRTALAAGGAVGAISSVVAATKSEAANPGPGTTQHSKLRDSRPISPNGWPVERTAEDGGGVWTRDIPGTGGSYQVRLGDTELVLTSFIARYHYEVLALGPEDVIGHREPASLRGCELNHASGTAVDILPGRFPTGTRGNMFRSEREALGKILADYGGVIRWGGWFKVPRESHFEVAVAPGDGRFHATLTLLRRESANLGRWPGTRSF